MQTGYAHQVAHPGSGEQLPVVAIDRALVADRKRDDDTAVRRIGQRILQARTRGLARPIDRGAERPDKRGQQALRRFAARRANIAGGANATFQQPCLVVEAVRVGATVRLAQAQVEAPTFPRMNHRIVRRGVRYIAAVPCQLNPSRQRGAGGQYLLGREFKADPALKVLGQRCDDADDLDVAAFERFRQLVSKAHMGECCGPGDAGGDGGREPYQSRRKRFCCQ